MTDTLDLKSIADGLTKAQKSYLCEKAAWRSPDGRLPRRWMTFPPSNTHRVLMRQGLVDGVGQIRETGLALRDYLSKQQ